MTNKSIILSMNVSWLPEDLILYDNQSGLVESVIFTLIRFITLVMAIIVHRAFYKLMKRLPGRAINQIMYPYMVIIIDKNQVWKIQKLNDHKFWTNMEDSNANILQFYFSNLLQIYFSNLFCKSFCKYNCQFIANLYILHQRWRRPLISMFGTYNIRI